MSKRLVAQRCYPAPPYNRQTVICGYRTEEITDPVTKQVRYLDKLVDELAKSKKMENVLRDV
ncbi:MAG: DUF2200 family protein [Balneolaceae bacterium]|nr:MAG: DUF2200 family protein [Balneolaceae bacterium]